MRALGICMIVVLLGITGLLDSREAAAAIAELTLRDGRVIEGEFVSEDENQVVILVAGIRTTIDRADIRRMELRPTIEDEYAQRRAELRDDDIEGRYDLAIYLFDQRAFQLARRELTDLRRVAPDDDRVQRLLAVVEARIKLIEEAREEPRPRPPVEPRPDPREPRDRPDLPRLSPEQINQIKAYEVILADEPHVTVPRDVLEEVLERYAAHDRTPRDPAARAALLRQPGYRQLEFLFDVRARDYYSKVEIRGDAAHIQDFRLQMHRQYVLNYCATAQCHGGDDHGGFFLFRDPPNADSTFYTNYYILYQYENEQGEMIDLPRPDRSLLLQYGLARRAAAHPHPEVPGWRPMFVSERDQRYQNFVEVLQELGRNKVNYRINYQPPFQTPRETRPTDAPSAEQSD